LGGKKPIILTFQEKTLLACGRRQATVHVSKKKKKGSYSIKRKKSYILRHLGGRGSGFGKRHASCLEKKSSSCGTGTGKERRVRKDQKGGRKDGASDARGKGDHLDEN